MKLKVTKGELVISNGIEMADQYVLGGGTVLRFGRSPAKNCGGLGLSETMSKSIFGPNLIIFWYLE